MRGMTSSSMRPRRDRTTGLSLLVAVCVAALSSVLNDVGFAEAPSKIARKSFKPMRDPAKPKKPLTPWLQFATKYRQDNPGLGKEALTKASAAWKNADAATKRELEEKYEAALNKHKEEMAAYKSSGKEEAWLRPPGKPKKPPTPFIMISQELWKQGAVGSVIEAAKAASGKWKGMSASEKAPYEEEYSKAKDAYAAAMEKYKASGAREEWERKVGILEQKEKAAAKVARAKAKAKEEAAKARKAVAKPKAKSKAKAKAKSKAKAKAKSFSRAKKA